MDTGGQRNERRKWIHAVTGMQLLVFCVALSDYDKLCYEDDKTNRLHESLNIWTKCIGEPWFRSIPKLLLFTKLDLFKEKIKNVDLRVCFPNYNGLFTIDNPLFIGIGSSYEDATKFIERSFLEKV